MSYLRPYTAQKMKFSIKDFFSKCDQADLVTFTEEILDGKLHFLCAAAKYLFNEAFMGE